MQRPDQLQINYIAFQEHGQVLSIWTVANREVLWRKQKDILIPRKKSKNRKHGRK